MNTVKIYGVNREDSGFLQIKFRLIGEAGNVIPKPHLHGMSPGEDIDFHMQCVSADLVNNYDCEPISAESIQTIKMMAGLTWTPEIVEAQQARVAEQEAARTRQAEQEAEAAKAAEEQAKKEKEAKDAEFQAAVAAAVASIESRKNQPTKEKQ